MAEVDAELQRVWMNEGMKWLREGGVNLKYKGSAHVVVAWAYILIKRSVSSKVGGRKGASFYCERTRRRCLWLACRESWNSPVLSMGQYGPGEYAEAMKLKALELAFSRLSL